MLGFANLLKRDIMFKRDFGGGAKSHTTNNTETKINVGIQNL